MTTNLDRVRPGRSLFVLAMMCAAMTLSPRVLSADDQAAADQETDVMREMVEAAKARAARNEPAKPGPLDLKLSGNNITVETLSTGEIVLMGNKADLDLLESFLAMVDRKIPDKEVVLHTLSKAAADQVAEQLTTIIPQIWPGIDQMPDQNISITALTSNRLLIAAPASRVDRIIEIIEAIDEVTQAELPQVTAMTFMIKFRKAAEVAEQVGEIVKKLQAQVGADESEQITLEVNDANNSIVVFGPPGLEAQIQNIINTIDIEPTEGHGHLKLVLFPLLNVQAGDLKDVLTEMLATTSGGQDLEEAIRRLSIIKREADGTRTELQPLDLDKPLRLLADKGTNSLIVATVEANIETLGEIVKLLDGVPLGHEMGMKIFPLRFADAGSIKDMLDSMFSDGKKLPERAPGGDRTEAVPPGVIGPAFMYNVNIHADKRTNVLFVSGRPEQLMVAQMIVSEVDVPMTALKFPLRMLSVGQNVDATRLKSIVDTLFEKRIEVLTDTEASKLTIAREKVYVAVHVGSNALIVSAAEENYDEIRSIVDELNAAALRRVDNIRLIACRNTNASDLATKIDELWARKAALRSRDDLPEDSPILVADARSNALIIASNAEDFDEIEALIERLEDQPLSPVAEIRLITLGNNDATQVSDMLKSLFEDRMTQRLASGQVENPADRVAVVADSATNTILVASSTENYEEMQRIVEAIDIEPDIEGVIKAFVLHNAEAQPVADKIRELFDQGLYNPTVGLSDNQVIEERSKVAIIADARSNSIVVSASKTNLSIIETLIGRMDGGIADILSDDTKIIHLEFADAVKLVDMLEKLFEGRKAEASEPDLFRTPTIIADARSNTLIISSTRDALHRCEDLITQLDRPSGPPTSTFEVYALEHGSAAKLATRMQELFDQRAEGADEVATPINIQADESSNALIASASRDDHVLIRGLLDLLDKPSNIARQFQIFPLGMAKASTVAETLDQLFQQQAEGSSGRADAIAVQPDDRSNSLVVWASGSEMDNIKAIIQKLDTAEPAVEMTMKVIRLKQALAEDFAQVFTDTLLGGNGQGDGEEAVIVSFTEKLDDGTEVVRKLLRQDITINPDPRTNAVMVMAPAASMDMLESMIRDFDSIKPVTAEIAIFPLVNADAEEIVNKLDELFATDEQGGDGIEQRIVFGGDGAATVTGGDSGSPRQMIRFTADRRTNTVLAAGNRVDLDMAEELIAALDSRDIVDRIHEVYKPLNVTASQIEASLSSFADAENELLSELDDEVSIRRRAEKRLTVVSDEDSNTLLLGASPRYYDEFADLVRQIDRPEPQVMISVLIAEVSIDDRMELGVEFAVQDLNFSEVATVGNNGVIMGNDRFDVVAGTDIGAAGVGFGGLSLTVSGEDFAFLFRALKSQGQLEVLSRPTLLVQNNATGNITIGDRVPIISGSTSAGGQSSTQVNYEEVGIILDVTPHINPDGYVNLEIAPEISSISNTTLQVADGVNAAVFSERTAETTVTVKDGETVILGGLITERHEETTVSVPFFGDLPIIGNLFKSDNKVSNKTELLIVLSVHVLRDELELRHKSQQEIDITGRLPDRVKRSALMEGLRIHAEDDEFGPEGDMETIPRERSKPIRRDPGIYGPVPGSYGPPRPTAAPEFSDAIKPSAKYGPVLAEGSDQ
jgi:type II secretion system protein D